MPTAELQYVVVHGYRRAYRTAGTGPALLLVHGLACDSSTWDEVIAPLAEHFTVIAPDLLGHGESDKPDADYSLGGYANAMRDLLTILGVDKVTVIGHSFGGGVAMQFAYQFPERTERVVLVSTGGLGREVTPMIRMLTLPGSGTMLAVATAKPWRPFVRTGLRALAGTGWSVTRDLGEVARIYDAMAEPGARNAIRRLTGNVLDWRGQFVTMTDRTYLAQLMPVLVVWGRQDQVIPVAHAAHAASHSLSDVRVFDDSGHFPHKDHPAEFVAMVTAFVQDNPPAIYHRGKWRAMLRRGDQAVLTTVPPAPSSPAVL
ncbi:alpha/beta fold hydrolase [Aeromicrobium marinum]|nr:alpha/beta fold hydrolase [Aeromicrobium marinum]